MDLKDKLLALGFKEMYKQGQCYNRELDLYVYVKYNKIKYIQIAKVWELKNFRNYTEYLSKVNHILELLESTLYDVEE